MTELKPTKLFAIPIDREFNMQSKPNYLDNIDFDFKFLGTVTKDEIDFDVEPFSQRLDFYSLIRANECYFENPLGARINHHTFNRSYNNGLFRNFENYANYKNNWQSAQEKCNDKYLIIEKL